ncbi:metalloendopeptidase-like membrane protein [Janibacter sp. HTCC2649]|uniref:peptidoglycan DD-metalloendopeptidase family protein n=1 Tax=Janibacter sp. HTCC2649 TaxID=313589 RepID=UPI000066EA96|nr:peptidoglycan DD-metalloendopeptidase family protein [Janibacter sp. HTCC2649]EAP98675.1 metalloendopeptidase-like membrane protein [Janibacter sp. HTCC2649]
MKRALWVLTPLLAVLFVIPLGAAVTLAAVITPVAAEQARLNGCGTTVAASGSWRPPFQQAYVRTSHYGNRFHPIEHVWRLHSGTDLVSQPGPGPVVAVSTGTVVTAAYRGGYGNAVDVDHGGGITSRYAHLARIDPTITVGATVTAGQVLGVEGSTGASTGNHLHLEILNNGDPVDPVPFMADRGAPLDGRAVAPTPTTNTPRDVEGGIGFDLPPAGTPRLASLTTPPATITAPVKALYVAAAQKYQLPWTLLAAIGMEETAHGRTTATSTAGAQGLMQFMPATFAAHGVDGDSDGAASIRSDADSVFSAASYLTQSGVTKGPDGVRNALYAYNHATWYVNDVLHYAHAYGGGLVLGDPGSCAGGEGNPNLTPLPADQVAALLAWAEQQTGDQYVFGANGPDAWDCSSFTQAAYRHIGLTLPRTAGAQRDWLAAGGGARIPPGKERPGDLIFWDSYLGPNAIGHVVIVQNPTTRTTFEAKNPHAGVGTFSYAGVAKGKHIYEIWRPGATEGAQ